MEGSLFPGYVPHLPLEICIHSLPIQLISSQTVLNKKQHGLKKTIPAKRSTCLCPCSVRAALHPFLPLLSLGVQRLWSLKLAYPTHNCSCSGKKGFQKDLVLLRKRLLLADGLCSPGERFPSGNATDSISLGSVLPTQWVSSAQLSVPLRQKMKRGNVC